MDIEIVAVHEAGHAVMQWFVGWVPKGIYVTGSGANVTKAETECPAPELSSKSAIPKKLLVLLAGNEATRKQWPNSMNNMGDWQDIMTAVRLYFGWSSYDWKREHGMALTDPEANRLLQDARVKTTEILENGPVRAAVDQIAATLKSLTPDSDRNTTIAQAEIAAICEQNIGNEFREANPWVDWMADK